MATRSLVIKLYDVLEYQRKRPGEYEVDAGTCTKRPRLEPRNHKEEQSPYCYIKLTDCQAYPRVELPTKRRYGSDKVDAGTCTKRPRLEPRRALREGPVDELIIKLVDVVKHPTNGAYEVGAGSGPSSKRSRFGRRCNQLVNYAEEEDERESSGSWRKHKKHKVEPQTTPLVREVFDQFFDEHLTVRKQTDTLKTSYVKLVDCQAYPATIHRRFGLNEKTKVSWSGKVVRTEGSKKYYRAFMLNDEAVCIGECVSLKLNYPDKPLHVARVLYMWEDKDHKYFHGQMFSRGTDTVLGDTCDPLELFLVDQCQDNFLSRAVNKVTVILKEPAADWNMLGGISDPDSDRVVKEDDGRTFFYQLWYDGRLARFEDPPKVAPPSDEKSKLTFCPSCVRAKEIRMRERPQLSGCLDSNSDRSEYQTVLLDGNRYTVGKSAYVRPGAIKFKVKAEVKRPKTKRKAVDCELYPEAYRKGAYIQGSNDNCPPPFRVCRIIQIYTGTMTGLTPSDVRLKIGKYYRPEDTHKRLAGSRNADLNLLYWSDEVTTVTLNDLHGSCKVIYSEDLSESIDEYSQGGRDRFYFTQSYDADTRKFKEPPKEAYASIAKPQTKGKGNGKGKGKAAAVTEVNSTEHTEESCSEIRRLRMLDVFAGCGGLSEGLHQSGVGEACWAIEKDDMAARTFHLNNPGCTVFTEDCNRLLRLAMEGKTVTPRGQRLPKKGEVELLCGGPPCQGFSGMNRYNSRENARLKNSLISSYLSYCDFYRPRFFLLENVRNFVSFQKSMVLKLTLRCLVRMGYQCTFGVLQAGSYGVAQSRRRTFILAAAPGEKLPHYPEPTHTFTPRGMSLSVKVGENNYESLLKNSPHAPLRTISVRDAISDLPEIGNGADSEAIDYSGGPQSCFQRKTHGVTVQPTICDHICKNLSSLNLARIQHIPLAPGSDWRDMPNVEAILSDGSTCKRLRYTHEDKNNGRSSGGHLRGVCRCADEKHTCHPSDRQSRTLIPWCLPHTGNRYNNWAGLYGRLDWDGYFSTTVTDPNPVDKQGRVLHPEQHRVVSVRECARSQGFPDSYRFVGSVLDRHRQVGNAVPPPLAQAIGYAMKRCLVKKQKEFGCRVVLRDLFTNLKTNTKCCVLLSQI